MYLTTTLFPNTAFTLKQDGVYLVAGFSILICETLQVNSLPCSLDGSHCFTYSLYRRYIYTEEIPKLSSVLGADTFHT